MRCQVGFFWNWGLVLLLVHFGVESVSKNHEFCIRNEESCIKNEELCIKNQESCIKNDELCRCAAICRFRSRTAYRKASGGE